MKMHLDPLQDTRTVLYVFLSKNCNFYQMPTKVWCFAEFGTANLSVRPVLQLLV